MVVLSRNPKRRFVLGEKLELVVVDLSGGRLKLGIKWPSEVRSIAKKFIGGSNLKTAANPELRRVRLPEVRLLFS